MLSAKLDDLESSNSQKDDIITCQQSDIEKLTAKVRKLDVERMSLLAQQQSLTSDQRNALTVLQQVKLYRDMPILLCPGMTVVIF